MRLVIQRVNQASVSVDKKIVGKIGEGLFILVGVGREDRLEDAEVLAEKVAKLRIMADEKGKMNLSIKDVSGEILAVSQFTLQADTSGGNRPSFIKAASPAPARKIYERFVAELKGKNIRVAIGEFGAYMKIVSELDGPVTIILDTEKMK